MSKSKDTLLKKQWKEKDVQRLRNIVQGKYGEKTTKSVGYTKVEKDYKEGDIWQEDGRTWTIKDNIKQNITKLDKAKESINLPLFCPNCKKIMNHQYDKPFYLQYGHCYDCQIKFETDLRVKGLWQIWHNTIIENDIDHIIGEFNIFSDELENDLHNNSYVNENGNLEKWSKISKKKLAERRQQTIQYLEDIKKKSQK